MRRLLIGLLALGVTGLASGMAWAVYWPGWRIPVGWEFMRAETGDLIEEEVQTGGTIEYIVDEHDNGPRLPRS